jgi:replicative DNA helicase
VAGVDILHEIAHREERDLAEIAQVLRATAKSVSCALITCVHLNDNRVTTPRRPVPVLRDVRGSGMLVRGADVVLLIHRDDDEDGVPTPQGTLFAAKIRNGQPNAMGVVFQPNHMRFVPRVAA